MRTIIVNLVVLRANFVLLSWEIFKEYRELSKSPFYLDRKNLYGLYYKKGNLFPVEQGSGSGPVATNNEPREGKIGSTSGL